LYYEQGKYAAAEPLYKRSLAIWGKKTDDPTVAVHLNNLANLYKAQNKYDEAEALYKRSLVIREKAVGPDHPFVAVGLNNLANLYANQGKYDEAESLCKRSLGIYEKALGPNHPDLAVTLNSLAELERVSAGTVVEIPAPDDNLPYFTVKCSRPDQTNETLTILVRPKPRSVRNPLTACRSCMTASDSAQSKLLHGRSSRKPPRTDSKHQGKLKKLIRLLNKWRVKAIRC
jgi:tetratricopeptide (TPR) repeat protein